MQAEAFRIVRQLTGKEQSLQSFSDFFQRVLYLRSGLPDKELFKPTPAELGLKPLPTHEVELFKD